jgi:hypothetical protein
MRETRVMFDVQSHVAGGIDFTTASRGSGRTTHRRRNRQIYWPNKTELTEITDRIQTITPGKALFRRRFAAMHRVSRGLTVQACLAKRSSFGLTCPPVILAAASRGRSKSLRQHSDPLARGRVVCGRGKRVAERHARPLRSRSVLSPL